MAEFPKGDGEAGLGAQSQVSFPVHTESGLIQRSAQQPDSVPGVQGPIIRRTGANNQPRAAESTRTPVLKPRNAASSAHSPLNAIVGGRSGDQDQRPEQEDMILIARDTGGTFPAIHAEVSRVTEVDALRITENETFISERYQGGEKAPTKKKTRERVSIKEQKRRHALVTQAAKESMDLPPPSRTHIGPYTEDFMDIKRYLAEQLAAISESSGVSLTPEIFLPVAYRPYNVKKQNDQLDTATQKWRDNVVAERLRRSDRLADKTIAPALAQQTIPEGLLAVPEFYRQEESTDASKSCTAANFRMIFGDIAGWVPTEWVLGDALKQVEKGDLYDDDTYLKLLQTQTFLQETGKRVAIADYMGADLDKIAEVARKVRDRNPEAKVYAMVNLGSERRGSPHIWHANILLSADADNVICHDPTPRSHGGPYRAIPKEDFARRWAVAYNRMHIIVAW